jgi:hypothetical protein
VVLIAVTVDHRKIISGTSTVPGGGAVAGTERCDHILFGTTAMT